VEWISPTYPGASGSFGNTSPGRLSWRSSAWWAPFSSSLTPGVIGANASVHARFLEGFSHTASTKPTVCRAVGLGQKSSPGNLRLGRCRGWGSPMEAKVVCHPDKLRGNGFLWESHAPPGSRDRADNLLRSCRLSVPLPLEFLHVAPVITSVALAGA
jgi:hypothetical protein